MKIIIVGGGLSGKATASLLMKAFRASRPNPSLDLKRSNLIEIILFSGSEEMNALKGAASDHYTGIWNPGMAVLEKLVGSSELLNQHSKSIGKSCYKSMDGSVLLSPTKGMQAPPSKLRLT
jgi:hypothetical protein